MACILAAITLLTMGGGLREAGATTLYNVIDLGSNTTPVSVNNLGQIAGSGHAVPNTNRYALFWSNSVSPVIVLASVGNPTRILAACINNSGQMVGQSTLPDLTAHSVFWSNNLSTDVDLGGQIADGINGSGQIVGQTTVSNLTRHAIFWTNSLSGLVDLGTLGGTNSGAASVNSSGQVVGGADVASGLTHAAFWSNSTSAAVDLGTLGGTNSAANGINDLGQIAGQALTSNEMTHAAYWTNSASRALDLGTLGGSNSVALGVNNLGQIVGGAFTSNEADHAAIWMSGNSPALDLNGLIPTNANWVLQGAFGINDLGEIVGVGMLGGQNHGFALVPVNLPFALSIKTNGLNVVLVFSTAIAARYDIQSRTDLVAGAWSTIASNIVGEGGLANINVGAVTGPTRFYHVGAGF